MASPPTPNSFAPGDVISWGPTIERGQRLRAGRILELVKARLEAPEDETADRLLALTNTHRYVLVERIAKSRHSTVCVAVDRLLTRDVVSNAVTAWFGPARIASGRRRERNSETKDRYCSQQHCAASLTCQPMGSAQPPSRATPSFDGS